MQAMNSLTSKIPELTLLMIWIASFSLGGFFLIVNTFKVRRYEATLLGFGLGLVLQTFFSNWIARIIEVKLAFFLSSIIVLLLGLLVTLFHKNFGQIKKNIYFPVSYWAAFVLITLFFFMIGRGLAIFDDYQNLPMTSFIASGSIPPQFVLNPEFSFDYHYLMLLNAAQWMRVADIFPWTALDLTRAIYIGLTLIYSAFLARRITFSFLAGWLTALFVAFAGGIRWVLLFFPESLINLISDSVKLMGSGLGTAENLKLALISIWAVEGGGPIGFPFAFGNGYHTIAVMEHDGTGLMGTVIALLIILLLQKWKNLYGMITLSMLIAAMALIDEIWFVFFLSATALVLTVKFFHDKERPRKTILLTGLFIILIPAVLSLFQGGVLTGIFDGILLKGMGGSNGVGNQYYSMNFPIRWPPAIISAHLGILYLTRWTHLLAALCEIGPVILMIPLFLLWGWKSFRSKQWIFSILAVATIASLLMIFVEYQGSAGISASKRLTLFATDLLIIFAIPLIWLWLRKRKDATKGIIYGIVLVTMIGGIVNFSIEAISIQEPVLSYFIDPLDARTQEKYWNVLEENAIVFDRDPSRSATVFARASKSKLTWYEYTPEYKELLTNPVPEKLLQQGYEYVYLSKTDWNDLNVESQKRFTDTCVKKIFETSNSTGDFRWLLDITACKK